MKNPFLNGLAILALLFSASAANASNGNIVFSCFTKNKKEIKIVQKGNKFTYSFGKINLKPDISLTRHESQLMTYAWTGVGKDMPYGVTFQNGEYSYTVYETIARDYAEDEVQVELLRGVYVEKNGKKIADIPCLHGDAIYSDLQTIAETYSSN
ncbi:hypothetical protein ACM5Q9_03275 [Advenella sp. RU8]|uniref:hypothetical protein n=1 Tax=Advenella sp. RU8 TaxID=3399575 RepID=UPI003AAF2AC9